MGSVENKEKEDLKESSIDDLLADVEAQDSTIISSSPILDLVKGYGFEGGPVIANFSIKDKEKVIGYLDNPEVRKLLPNQYRYIRFIWGNEDEQAKIVGL